MTSIASYCFFIYVLYNNYNVPYATDSKEKNVEESHESHESYKMHWDTTTVMAITVAICAAAMLIAPLVISAFQGGN